MQLTYMGKINGVITQRNRVLNRFEIHNSGLIGIQYLFAYAASRKLDLVDRYIPNYILVYHNGEIVSKLPIKISGLRYETTLDDEGNSVPSACFDFVITAENIDSEYDINELSVKVFSAQRVELAWANMNEADFAKIDSPTLKTGLQVNASWKMYIKGGAE